MPTSTRTREPSSFSTFVSIGRLTLEERKSDAAGALRLSRVERLEAWALTGPPGRVWGFAADVASAMPLLARYWVDRVGNRDRSPDH
jgi:hypothetical protein